MIVYEIYTSMKDEAQKQFFTYEEAKHYGLTHHTEFYVQPKFIITEKEYFNERK